MKISRCLMFPAVIAVGLTAISCARVGNALVLGGMSSAANDQIMLVREKPPSFGYQRLGSQIDIYPDLGFFVSKKGLPDFLAETSNRERRYLILYYLAKREAYACRTRTADRRTVEFAGPYPVTDREFRMLDGFRRDPARRPVKW